MPPFGWAAADEEKVQIVLGRLPQRYRLTIWIAGLVSCAGVGAWAGLVTPLPLMWSSGAAVGVLLGVVLVTAYLAVLEGGSNPREPAEPQG